MQRPAGITCGPFACCPCRKKPNFARMFENSSRTELSQLGEFGLIDHITRHVKLHNASTIKGVGDDAAVIDNGSKLSLLTTDMLVEGSHFDLSYTPLKHL